MSKTGDEMINRMNEKAHLEESSEMARRYFVKCGLDIHKITFEDCSMLRVFLDNEITKLLLDKSYAMISELRTNAEIKFTKTEICLYADGYYFKKRQAISFEITNDFIGFCDWASGCNRIPFIKGFVLWCDWMKEKK